MNERARRAEREDSIRRTVYVSEIGIHVSTGVLIKKVNFSPILMLVILICVVMMACF